LYNVHYLFIYLFEFVLGSNQITKLSRTWDGSLGWVGGGGGGSWGLAKETLSQNKTGVNGYLFSQFLTAYFNPSTIKSGEKLGKILVLIYICSALVQWSLLCPLWNSVQWHCKWSSVEKKVKV
jgi:hypothetical protein